MSWTSSRFIFLSQHAGGGRHPVEEAARQLNAAILGLMREALISFVSKGMVKRKLNQADQGQAQLHDGWHKALGHSNAARWWLQHVARVVVVAGAGCPSPSNITSRQ